MIWTGRLLVPLNLSCNVVLFDSFLKSSVAEQVQEGVLGDHAVAGT